MSKAGEIQIVRCFGIFHSSPNKMHMSHKKYVKDFGQIPKERRPLGR
jgi:hypothetical protein